MTRCSRTSRPCSSRTRRNASARRNFCKLFGAASSLPRYNVPTVRMNALAHLHHLLSAFAKYGTEPVSLRRPCATVGWSAFGMTSKLGAKGTAGRFVKAPGPFALRALLRPPAHLRRAIPRHHPAVHSFFPCFMTLLVFFIPILVGGYRRRQFRIFFFRLQSQTFAMFMYLGISPMLRFSFNKEYNPLGTVALGSV